ncbi:MAG: YdcF family protein [Acidobacteria bacterium]|nr:YdcF family protein [Acidobacteriota bacterium]
MKYRLYTLLLLGLVAIGFFFFPPRSTIIKTLKIDTALPDRVDLIAVLGGGIAPDGTLGNSTRERLDAVVEYEREGERNCLILVQEYPAGRKKMVAYLIANGLDKKNILSSGFHYRDERGGTENNIAELFHVLDKYEKMQRIVLVTSPYHQRRVKLMLKAAEKHGFERKVHFYFLQLPDNGEISRCSRWRFWHLVTHEALGIFFQQLKD